jgi:hypothetical protein
MPSSKIGAAAARTLSKVSMIFPLRSYLAPTWRRYAQIFAPECVREAAQRVAMSWYGWIFPSLGVPEGWIVGGATLRHKLWGAGSRCKRRGIRVIVSAFGAEPTSA